jgi:hypothetical protein
MKIIDKKLVWLSMINDQCWFCVVTKLNGFFFSLLPMFPILDDFDWKGNKKKNQIQYPIKEYYMIVSMGTCESEINARRFRSMRQSVVC